jgi:ABC-type transporter Mla subunit MlaD
LETNAAVKYRGVPVGRVISIQVAPDNRLVEVVMKLDPESRLQGKTEDLAAQLKITGITGSMFIELDRKDALTTEVASFDLAFQPKYQVIDTVPSDIKQFMEQVNQTLDQLNALEIESISTQIIAIMENLNTIIEDKKIRQIFSDAHELLSSLTRLAQRPQWERILKSAETSGAKLNTVLDELSTSLDLVQRVIKRTDGILKENRDTLETALQEFKATGSQARELMQEGRTTVSSGQANLERLFRQLSTIARKLDQAAETLNDALERIRQQPSQLLFSEPPKPRELRQTPD